MERTYRYAPFNQHNSDGGMLDAIYVGTTSNNSATDSGALWARLRLEYDYDSFANLKTLREGFNGGSVVTHDFTYDAYNRLLTAFGYGYAYDTAGRLTSYEGAALGYDSVKKHAVNTVGGTDRYDYDANGNVTVRHKGLSTQQTLTWSHENRLASLTATGLSESYLYDDAGMRMKKTSNGVATYYPFPHYEVSGSSVTKYYFFAGQRVAMKRGSGASPTCTGTGGPLGAAARRSPPRVAARSTWGKRGPSGRADTATIAPAAACPRTTASRGRSWMWPRA